MWCLKMVCHMRTRNNPAHLNPLQILLEALVLAFVNPDSSDLPSPSAFPATSAQSRCPLLPAENLSLGAGPSSAVRLLVKTPALPQTTSVSKLEFSSTEKWRRYAFSARLPWGLGETNTHRSTSWSVRHKVGAR